MSKFGSSSIKIYITDSTGGSWDMTGWIDMLDPKKITAITEPTMTFGDAWEEHTPTGISRGEPFNFEGHFDNTATSGPHAVFRTLSNATTGTARDFVFGVGSVAYEHSTVLLTSYEVLASNGKLTRFRSNALPTGTVTWTTSTS